MTQWVSSHLRGGRRKPWSPSSCPVPTCEEESQVAETRFTLERQGHVFLIGINRADKGNAFDLSMLQELALACGELDRDRELRCGVLFAHGKHFTLGLDLEEVAPLFAKGRIPLPEGGIDITGVMGDQRLSKPLVCAMHGLCFTLGIELALACDIRVAAPDTRFAQIEVGRGIYAVGGATVRFVREAGWGNAMRYLLTGDTFRADEALRMGIIQEITQPGKHLERAIELAQLVAEQAPLGVQATLASARRALREGELSALHSLLPDLLPLMRSKDAAEGLRSFVERRKGTFVGE